MHDEITISFFDYTTRKPIEHEEALPKGILTLDKIEDVAYINLLLKVEIITMCEKVYKVKVREFNLDTTQLFILLEEQIKDEPTEYIAEWKK